MRPVTVCSCCLVLAMCCASSAVPAEGDWIPLFNGKDLTGWKQHPDDTNKWEVKDGALTASGEGNGHLYTERGDYENVVFRIEAKINDKGNSGQYFRTKFEPGFPKGYEAQINATGGDAIQTGSLYPDARTPLAKHKDKITVMNTAAHKPDEWFTQEVTAIGPKITIKVNGKTTIEFEDPEKLYATGHFALQGHDPGSIMSFRKIEVKELKAK